MFERAIAPIYSLCSRCPTMNIATIPSRGTVMFDIILGTAKRRMSLFILGDKVSSKKQQDEICDIYCFVN